MRIGIFTDAYTPYISGLVTSEVMLKESLEKLGHIVYVVTANLETYSYEYDEKEKVLRIPGIPTGIYNSRLTSIYPIRAINKIKTWKLDVIHSQSEFAVGSFARLFGKQYGIPVVHTYHTMYEDYVHYITKGHFNKSSKKIVEYLTKFYCDKTITELIVPTKKTYDLFKEKYNVDRNIYIIPTGIEIERFYKQSIKQSEINDLKKELNINKKDFVMIFVGRLAKEKNIEFILNLMKKINKKNANIKLLVVGDGPDKEEYQKLANKNTIFTGKVSWNKIPIYYNISNLFITASKSETQGLTVIEAMAASIPVLCVEDESFKQIVIDDLNGYLFNDEEEAIKLIEKIMHDKKLHNRLSKGSLTTAQMHSSKYFAQQVLDVYKKAIEVQSNKLLNKLKKIVNRVVPWK